MPTNSPARPDSPSRPDLEGLKACPFCGGPAEIWEHPGLHNVACGGCGSQPSDCIDMPDLADAIVVWNKRVPDPSLIAHVERLQEVVAGFVGDLTDCGRNRDNMLSIEHDALRARVKQARATLSQGTSHE